jgi:uncharacterized pyridoxamine 5'-phosphate oxidase family protein
MEEVIDFMEQSKLQYFATIGIDGRPKVRPFKFMFTEEGKLWFCTANHKAVYKELQHQPWIELCASGTNNSWIRLSGMVVFENNLSIKEKVFEVSPLVKSIYNEPNNPLFEVFYLTEISASISSIGKEPQTIKF